MVQVPVTSTAGGAGGPDSLPQPEENAVNNARTHAVENKRLLISFSLRQNGLPFHKAQYNRKDALSSPLTENCCWQARTRLRGCPTVQRRGSKADLSLLSPHIQVFQQSTSFGNLCASRRVARCASHRHNQQVCFFTSSVMFRRFLKGASRGTAHSGPIISISLQTFSSTSAAMVSGVPFCTIA